MFDATVLLGEYGSICILCAPLFLFIVAVSFRLLDNSAAVFLSNDIMVASSYVATKLIKELLRKNELPIKIRKELKRALIFRKLHNLFMLAAGVSIPLVLGYVMSSW